MQYTNSAPVLETLQTVLRLSVDEVETACDRTLTLLGHKFVLQLLESDQEWSVYFPPDTRVLCYPRPARLVVQGSDFKGIVRLALSNNCSTGRRLGGASAPISPHCQAEGVPNTDLQGYWDLLDMGANTFPVRAQVSSALASPHTLVSTVSWSSKPCWPGVAQPGPLV
eukprot:RCo045674